MVISGTIGWFVVMSGQPNVDCRLWRCRGWRRPSLVCAALGHFRYGVMSPPRLPSRRWVARRSSSTGCYCSPPIRMRRFRSPRRSTILNLSCSWARRSLLRGAADGDQADLVGDFLCRDAADRSGKARWRIGLSSGYPAGTWRGFFYAVGGNRRQALKGCPHDPALVQVLTGSVHMLAPMAATSSRPAVQTWAILVGIGVVHTGLMYILR